MNHATEELLDTVGIPVGDVDYSDIRVGDVVDIGMGFASARVVEVDGDIIGFLGPDGVTYPFERSTLQAMRAVVKRPQQSSIFTQQ